MASSPSRTINGYIFGFFFGNAFGVDGVIIKPQEADLGNVEYVLAFKEALRMYDTFYAVCMISQFMGSRKIEEYDTDELGQQMIYAQIALSQRDWKLTDQDWKDAEWLLGALPLELAKREAKSKQKPRETIRKSPSKDGYVYLIQSPSGHYKIGRTNNPDNRLATFSVKLPFEVEYVCLIETPDMRGLEAELHQQFAPKRVKGEWFLLDAGDVAYIKELAT